MEVIPVSALMLTVLWPYIGVRNKLESQFLIEVG